MTSSYRALKAAPTEAERATYVASLLRIDPFHIFPAGPECTAEANQHLVDSVLTLLEDLTKKAATSPDRSPRALWFRRTLDHCNAVMSGKVNPADPGSFNNEDGYCRGIYVFREVKQDDR